MATTLMQSQDQWTIPLAVQSFYTQHATDYGPMNAFIFMSAIPVLVVYLMFQRYFVSGAFAGAVKG
jgi:raffinose/stachyose/melibiose transport system permease protein